MATQQLNDRQAERFFENGVHATATTTILRSPDELYSVWKSLDQLPRFIDKLKSVEKLDAKRSRWTVEGPMGKDYSWEAEIIRDEPGKTIAWRTTANSQVESAGSIRFLPQPGDRGTQVHVSMEYLPPGGALGEVVAKAARSDAKAHLCNGLHRFRQLMETGEVATVQGQPVGHNPTRKDRGEEGEANRKTDPNLHDLSDRGDVAPGSTN